ncbi:hypothetical protein N9A31_00205 [Candidatus Pelagibacter ubique]|nr:hypothetical protein [Candidatus Pelagibacter ubique]
MFEFYIPIYYLIHSRLKTKFDLISWQIIFLIPQFAVTYFYLHTRSDIFVQLFLISQLIFHTLYEVGYIENDVITTRDEKKPTLRLNKKSIAYLKKNYSRVIYFKYIIVIFFIGILYWIDSFTSYRLNLEAFLALLVFNRLIFFIHNSIRNRFNIFTFFILSATKYIFPLVLFVSFETMLVPIILMILIFPFLRTIEIFTLKKYKFKKIANLINNIDRFRVIYYLLCTIGLVVTWYFSHISNNNFQIFIFIAFYFLLFRVATKFLIEKGVYKRDDKTKTNSQYRIK